MSTIKTQISVKSSGDGIEGEAEWKPTLMTNTHGPAAGPSKYLIATGVTSISVPTGAMGMTIQPPAGSNAAMHLPGISGGTGMTLRTGYPSTNPLPTGTSSVLIGSNREELVYIHWG